MKRRILILGLFLVALLLVVFWWWNRPTLLPVVPVASSESNTPGVMQSPAPEPPSAQTLIRQITYEVPGKENKYQGISDPRWKWWKEIEKRDPKFEWKMPIVFYGKVIDKNNTPIAGASVRYGWNSVHGSNERIDKSDAVGLFSLSGVRGKYLSVKVEMDGYHSSGKSAGKGFEYAAFFEPNYHVPDVKNPVVFQLIKKQPSEPLVRTEQEVRLAQIGSVATVRLNSSTTIEIKLLDNEMKPDQPWSVEVTANGGGLQPTTDEFPVQAPESGYQSSMTLNRKSPKPPNWSGLYKGGIFYIKTEQGYGRVELEMIPGHNWMRVTTYANPSGSRNLESDLNFR